MICSSTIAVQNTVRVRESLWALCRDHDPNEEGLMIEVPAKILHECEEILGWNHEHEIYIYNDLVQPFGKRICNDPANWLEVFKANSK